MNPDGLYEWSHVLKNSQRYFQHDKMEIYQLSNTIQANLSALSSQLLNSASAAVAADSSLKSTLKLDGTYVSTTTKMNVDLKSMIQSLSDGTPPSLNFNFDYEAAYGARSCSWSSSLVNACLDLKVLDARVSGNGTVQTGTSTAAFKPSLAASTEASVSLVRADATLEGKGMLSGATIKASADAGTAYASADVYVDQSTFIVDGGVGVSAFRTECEFIYKIGAYDVSVELSAMAGGAEARFSGIVSSEEIAFGSSVGLIVGTGYNVRIKKNGKVVKEEGKNQ